MVPPPRCVRGPAVVGRRKNRVARVKVMAPCKVCCWHYRQTYTDTCEMESGKKREEDNVRKDKQTLTRYELMKITMSS